MPTLESLKAEHPEWCWNCEELRGHHQPCAFLPHPVIAALVTAKLEDEATIREKDARIAELEAKLVDAEQRVIIAEQAQKDDLNMRLDARGFISDLYAERGQDPRVAHLCNRALALLKP